MLPSIVGPERIASYDRILDCRSGPDALARYRKGHLPRARLVDLERDLSSPTERPEHGGRHPLPSLDAWCATLGRLGVTPDTHVLVYDDQNGANAAARAWWMLRAIGHADVSVLDGGIAAAVASGIGLDGGQPTMLDPRPPYPAKGWQLPTVDLGEVDRMRNDPSYRVIDVRAAERYRGEHETIDPVAGHMPGAINVPLRENLAADGRFKTPAELASFYRAQLGDVPVDHVVVSCGSGVTACHTLLALEHAGMTGAKLYVGSWSEWCRSDRPRG